MTAVLRNVRDKKVPVGNSTNIVLFSKEKVPYFTWYLFSLVLFPIHRDMWRGVNFLLKVQLPSSYCLGLMMF